MRLNKRAYPITFGLVVVCGVVMADTPTLSTFGTPGLVEVPTAETFADGELSFSASLFGPIQRSTISFQVLPRIYGAFRYSINEDFGAPSPGGQTDLFDRSFDIHFAILDEETSGVDLGIGLRDIIGTGFVSSEYVVASKTVADGVRVTGGLGWGTLGSEAGLTNPLTLLSSRFENREGFFGDDGTRDTGGQFSAEDWFSGDVGFFGGLSWDITDKIGVQIEYVENSYERESLNSGLTIDSPFNAAVEYRFDSGVSARAFTIGGNNFGGQLNFSLNPKERLVASGSEAAPRPIVPRNGLAAASWNGYGNDDLQTVLDQRLSSEGLQLDAINVTANRAELRVENLRYDVEAQAAGRAARVLANTLPPEVEIFEIVFQQSGLPLSSVTTRRSDLEQLQYNYDSAWRTQSRAQIEGAGVAGEAPSRFEYSLTPYVALSFFDPQSPIRADFGPQFNASYKAAPGLTFAGQLRYPLVGNLDESERESDSVIQRVRSESFIFARESELEVNRLTAEYLFRPGDEIFGRVTGGYLENQFGGISTEVLYRPVDSRFAFGAELNYARQRDFDMLFGFQEYDVVTGHASAYFDVGNGFDAQIDAGRYLAGDWGATFALAREFNNGVRLGAYFTLTDVPFDDFGEGSFDKGITVDFPLSWFTGEPSRARLSQTIQPLLRDGGARLNVDNRLYDLTSDYGAPELTDGWGRYLR